MESNNKNKVCSFGDYSEDKKIKMIEGVIALCVENGGVRDWNNMFFSVRKQKVANGDIVFLEKTTRVCNSENVEYPDRMEVFLNNTSYSVSIQMEGEGFNGDPKDLSIFLSFLEESRPISEKEQEVVNVGELYNIEDGENVETSGVVSVVKITEEMADTIMRSGKCGVVFREEDGGIRVIRVSNSSIESN